jgi:hypothetical protein
MSRKKDSFINSLPFGDRHPADAKLIDFTNKDLKREVVIRGMPFMKVITTAWVGLAVYYRENFFKKTNPALLDEFDKWQEEEILKSLNAKGKKIESWATDPRLRLGFIGETDGEGNTLTIKRIKGISSRVKKPKRERTFNNIYAGTKKAMTYELQKNGVSKEETIKLVKEKFPEANDKSIGIWYNKSKKSINNGQNTKKEALSEADRVKVLEEDLRKSGRGKKTLGKKDKN